MFKKFLSVLLSVIILTNFAPMVFATESYEEKTVKIHNGVAELSESVIEKDGEIYANAESIAKIFKPYVNTNGKERFVIKENDINLVFNLGDKYVLFSKDKKTISTQPVNFTQKYSGTIVHKSMYFYPLSEILPWMNVECAVDNGVMVIKPDIKSVWEISKDMLADEKLKFNILNEMEDDAYTVAALVAANVITDFIAIFSFDIPGFLKLDKGYENSFYSLFNYYDAFIDMASDDFMASSEAEAFIEDIVTINKLNDSIKNVLFGTNKDVDLPAILTEYNVDKSNWDSYIEMNQKFETMSKIATTTSVVNDSLKVLKAVETAAYVLPDYLDALESQKSNGADALAYNAALSKALKTLDTKKNALFVTLSDELVSFVVDKAVDVAGLSVSLTSAVGCVDAFLSLVWPVNESADEITRLPIYYNIQTSAYKKAIECKFNATSLENVHLMRVNYMLSLLASKQSYEAMQSVLNLIGKGHLKDTDIERLNLKMTEIAFAESAEENDVICDKSGKVKEIKELFEDVSVVTPLKFNYDKYGKYIGKDRAYALIDYPNAEEQGNDYGGVDGQLHITDSVNLIYAAGTKECILYTCHATDIYPNIAVGKSRMTRGEFENYLGVSTGFTSKEINSIPAGGDEICSATLWYTHKGYSFSVYCEDDGSIIFDKTVFWVSKEIETEPQEVIADNFTDTYWRVAFGPTNGSQYTVKMLENGRLLAWVWGCDYFYEGDYSYTGDILHIAIDGLSVDFKPKSEDEFVSEGFEVQGNIMYHAKAERIYDQQTIEEFEQQRVLINN